MRAVKQVSVYRQIFKAKHLSENQIIFPRRNETKKQVFESSAITNKKLKMKSNLLLAIATMFLVLAAIQAIPIRRNGKFCD